MLDGIPEEKSATLKALLFKDSRKNRSYVVNRMRKGVKDASLEYEVIGEAENKALVHVLLHTGRTHQIRAHFSHLGNPLLGDGKYGTNAQNKQFGSYKKQFLYSYKLAFDFKTDAGILEYLNHKEFEVEDVWFKKAFYEGTI